MSSRGVTYTLIAVAIFWILANSVFVVRQTERALLLRFGAVVQPDIKPGLHFKIPLVHTVKKFDGRVLTLDSRPERYFTSEKKPLIVDSFAKFKIQDVETFYTANSGDEDRAMRRLQERVNEGLRNQISRRDMHEVISGERDQLMLDLRNDLNKVVHNDLGIEVIDIRVKRIDLPPEVSNAVYERMKSEREIEARQHRATGQEVALGIRADADRQVVVIAADAYNQAEQIRGDGDAIAAATYAKAYSQDPEFYRFYRSLSAYTKTFDGREDILLLDPDSEFFRYLRSQDGTD